MKFLITKFLALTAYSVDEANTEVKNAALEMRFRDDGNSLLIAKMLKFYLMNESENSKKVDEKVEAMLSYGCYCQLTFNRKRGLGDCVDKFDE
jgi:hypothetical protein